MLQLSSSAVLIDLNSLIYVEGWSVYHWYDIDKPCVALVNFGPDPLTECRISDFRGDDCIVLVGNGVFELIPIGELEESGLIDEHGLINLPGSLKSMGFKCKTICNYLDEKETDPDIWITKGLKIIDQLTFAVG